mmetsp:Transcript_18644/g.56337  ORF Transcript_18644/g.56337 Transcript_18644/m.56337 type:complete len:542 (+) Transcript_18644:141-1766(+)|eukprot:CAMPEP_0206141726 /NCGR_PEP_ID=MMETSP1473-20131121/13883_1 /ASSEMBLY_ACC=CAM_ASM_001109 /TAXON_ID=1461547 /ORGANISM="Stichococcus sp, Strain RCC1054" /LENGTH=541 /DNA_ID=CAMNT_0053536405 /DNA_START=72 /DNA_END=1697 /DNA_ORIENTATION=+
MSHVAALHRSCSVCNRPVMQPFRPAAPPAASRARVVPAAFPSQRRSFEKSRAHVVCVRAVGTQAPPFGGQQTASGRAQQQPMQRVQQLFDLLREIGIAAAESGPTGFTRALQAGQAAASVGAEYAKSLQRGAPEPPARVLRKLFERLGSTYIKLGQFIASSPTVFPAEYVEEFQACLDSAPPVPWSTIRDILQKDMQQPVSEVFSYIEEKPLATASIAQVHRATLRASNRDVVIKVLKPGVEDLLGVDLRALEVMAKVLQFVDSSLERTSLVPILGDIKRSMLAECDFESEARNIQEFSNYLRRQDLESVATAPFVFTPFSSKRVLVMERLEGAPLTDLAAIRRVTAANPVDAEQTLINALNVWFGSVVLCRTFHADLHAGNLLVLNDGRVGFIDFGIVGSLAPASIQAIGSLAASAAAEDFESIARALATVGATRDDVDVGAFGRDLAALFKDFQEINPLSLQDALGAPSSSTAEAADQQVNNLLLRVVGISETHGVRFPREFALLIKQILYLDRYTRILAPELNWARDDRVDISMRAAL